MIYLLKKFDTLLLKLLCIGLGPLGKVDPDLSHSAYTARTVKDAVVGQGFPCGRERLQSPPPPARVGGEGLPCGWERGLSSRVGGGSFLCGRGGGVGRVLPGGGRAGALPLRRRRSLKRFYRGRGGFFYPTDPHPPF